VLLGNFPSRESDGEAAAAAMLEHPTFEADFSETSSDFGRVCKNPKISKNPNPNLKIGVFWVSGRNPLSQLYPNLTRSEPEFWVLGNFPSRESDGKAAAAMPGHPTFSVDFSEILSD
jgi:hypothetical protein